MKEQIKKIINKILSFLKKTTVYFGKHHINIVFYILAFILFINAIIMTIFFVNRNYDYKILNHLYIDAIVPDQDITNIMVTGIVKIEELDYNEISVNDKVVICCDFGLDENWVEDVVSIDKNTKTLVTTYNGIVTTNVSEDEVYGVFVKETSFIGTFYYTSMFLRGYILLMVSEILLLYIYHFLLMQNKLDEILNKKDFAEGDKHNEDS